MFAYNITFVVDAHKEKELLHYINDELRPKLFNNESPAQTPELKKVIETAGEKPGPDHALSIALSAVFETEEKAHLWNDHFLIPALGDFHKYFGEHALFFVTLLQILY